MLFGELAPIGDGRTIAPLKFLRDVTCSKAELQGRASSCAPLKADGFAIHPYQFTQRAPSAAGSPTTCRSARSRG